MKSVKFKFRMSSLFLLGLWLSSLCPISAEPKLAQLRQNFTNPPKEYSPVPLWWWSGEKLDKERMLWQLKEMKKAGIYNVCFIHLYPAGPDDPKYFSAAWWDIFKFIVEQAKKLGMHIWIYDQIGFAGAGTQNKVAVQNPQFTGRNLNKLEKDVTGGAIVELTVPQGAELVAATASKIVASEIGEPATLDQTTDITSQIKGKTLRWQAPEGFWKVMLFYQTPAGMDFLNPKACARLIDSIHGEYERRVKKYLGNVIPGSFQDELPPIQKWTRNFLKEFKSRKGYDLVPHLPALYYDIGDLTEKVRCDFYDVACSLAEESFFKPLFLWHEKYKMLCGYDQCIRNGDPIPGFQFYTDYFRTLRWFQAPGNDHGGNAKPHSSMAHLYNRPRVWLEGFHSSGWGQTLEEIAQQIHIFYQQGSNLYDPHAIYYSTFGSWWEWAPPCTSFRQPYWQYYKPFAQYVSRLSYILSQGTHICDIAVLYPTTSIWANTTLPGEPNQWAKTTESTYWALYNLLTQIHYDFDYIDDFSLQRAKPISRALSISGEHYKVIILPAISTIELKTLRRIKEFYNKGGIVIALKYLPHASAENGRGDPEVSKTVQEIFGCQPAEAEKIGQEMTKSENALGGKAYFIPQNFSLLSEVLQKILPPDVSPGFAYLHKKVDNLHIYFVLSGGKESAKIRFRVRGLPELWDAFTGETIKVHHYQIKENYAEVLIDFERSSACLLIFKPFKEEPKVVETNLEKVTKVWQSGQNIIVEGIAGKSIPSFAQINYANQKYYGYSESQVVQELPTIKLQGEWNFELRPTMQNRWGDFELPAYDDYFPVECRQFKYREEPEEKTGESLGWHLRDFDDSGWQKVTYSFGPYWLVSNTFQSSTGPQAFQQPFPPEQNHLRAPEVIWQPYYFSQKFGIEEDPVHWQTLGPKGKVPDEFIDLGLGPPNGIKYLCTWVLSPKEKTVQLWLGSASPKKVWVNDKLIINQPEGSPYLSIEPVRLNKGYNKVLIKVMYTSGTRLRLFCHLQDEERKFGKGIWIWYPEEQGPIVTRYFRKVFELTEKVKTASVYITCDNGYYLYVNGKFIGKEEGFEAYYWKTAERYEIANFLRKGSNVIAVKATNLGGPAGLLLEGEIQFPSSKIIRVFSDETWRTAKEAPKGWLKSEFDDSKWEKPQLLGPVPSTAPWEDIQGLGEAPEKAPLSLRWFRKPSDLIYDIAPEKKKRVGWYRFSLPPGTQEVELKINGRFKVYIDGELIKVPIKKDKVILPKKSSGRAKVCAIRVEQLPGSYAGAAFLSPARFKCGKGRITLGSWTDKGLPHYSGAAVYQKLFRVPKEYIGKKLTLDLGAVRGAAEVWLNNKKVAIRLWSPYIFDITEFVKLGINDLRIQVANTLGPHYHIGNPSSYVFPGQEISGILGPVEISASPKLRLTCQPLTTQ